MGNKIKMGVRAPDTPLRMRNPPPVVPDIPVVPHVPKGHPEPKMGSVSDGIPLDQAKLKPKTQFGVVENYAELGNLQIARLAQVFRRITRVT